MNSDLPMMMDTSQEPQRKERAGGVIFNSPSSKLSKPLSLHPAQHVTLHVLDKQSRLAHDVAPPLPLALPVPPNHDQSMLSSNKFVEYVDIFVDDFIGLAQKYSKGF